MATWVRTVDPTVEPVHEIDLCNHLRIDSTGGTAELALITAAREYIEEAARRALVTQTWKLYLDRWPVVDYIALPRPPLQSVTSLKYTDKDGTQTTWNSSNYLVDTASEPGRLVLAYGASWPNVTLQTVNPIEITYVCGYGANAVPKRWEQAVLLLAAHWYENREATITGSTQKSIPFGVESLINLDRGSFL